MRACWLRITIVLSIWATCHAQEAKQLSLVGYLSCASATCHGGALPLKQPHAPYWRTSLSVWQAKDRHAHAGVALLSEQSQAIVRSLYPETSSSENDRGPLDIASRQYRQVLNDRCVGCHATVARDQLCQSEPIELEQVYQGVSCESCHGPASAWIDAHTQLTWKARDAKYSSGMYNTDDWLARIEMCSRCHIGHRPSAEMETAAGIPNDGIIRDMNHDLIAAGHPALRFDGWLFAENSVPHWEDPLTTDTGSSSHLVRYESARLLALAVAATLERQRLVDHRSGSAVPWPEFSQFDCFSCHHDFQKNNFRSRVGLVGQPDWNPWFTGLLPGRMGGQTLAQLRLDTASDDEAAVARLEILGRIARVAREKAHDTFDKPPRPQSALANLRSAISIDVPLDDWHDAAAWYIRIQSALADARAAPNGLSAEQQNAILAILAKWEDSELHFLGDLKSPAAFRPETLVMKHAEAGQDGPAIRTLRELLLKQLEE